MTKEEEEVLKKLRNDLQKCEEKNNHLEKHKFTHIVNITIKYLIQFPHCTATIALGINSVLSGIGVVCFACQHNPEGTYSFAAMALVCLIGLIIVNCYYIFYNSNKKVD